MRTLCNTFAVPIMLLGAAAAQGGEPRSATSPALVFSEGFEEGRAHTTPPPTVRPPDHEPDARRHDASIIRL